MINFFRKIRKRLFNENRFAKYLLYAIGEIALIMIGILLALQIGIWNENKKNIKTENIYLTGILNNLNEDVEELKKLRTHDTLQLDAITKILKSFSDETINISELSNAALYSYSTSDFKGNNLTFEDMKYSGKTSLIQSNPLRLKILDYYSAFERYKSIEQRNNDIVINLEKGIISNVLDFNSIYEKSPILPDRWLSPVNDLDFSIFDKDVDSKDVRDFANNLTGIKLMYLTNHIEKIKLSKKAESLISDIEK